MIKIGQQENHNLWYRLWQGWGWAFNLFFGFVIAMLLAAVVTYAIASDGIYQTAYYLATSPAMTGLPFEWRLAIFGGGLFLVLAVMAAAWELVRYFYTRPRQITHVDIDMQLTAIMHEVMEIRDRVSE